METIAIVCPEVVSTESFDALMNEKGAYSTGQGSYTAERGTAVIFLSIEDEAHRDVDFLERLSQKISWTPQTVVLLSVGHGDGSLFLAFALASSIAERWNGFIDWGGLDQWEQWFQDWQQSRKRAH